MSLLDDVISSRIRNAYYARTGEELRKVQYVCKLCPHDQRANFGDLEDGVDAFRQVRKTREEKFLEWLRAVCGHMLACHPEAKMIVEAFPDTPVNRFLIAIYS